MSPQLRDRAFTVGIETGVKVLHAAEWAMLRTSRVPTTPFQATDGFGWIVELERNWKEIRAELDEVLTYRDDLPNFQDISVDQASITDDDGWKTFFFVGYGFHSEANCARCPRTAELIGAVPDLTTAFFSILSAHKKIPEHRGPWRGVLRYHLALRVPDPPGQCGITVGGQSATWEEGRSLLFDDGYDHHAWNDSDEVRVVLFVDVLRPLRAPADRFNRTMVRAIGRSPYIRDARNRHEAWERGFDRVRAGT